MIKKGLVSIIGAGPGDPELITVKAMKRLCEAEVVVFDRLANAQILEYVKEGAECIYAGKASDSHEMEQDEINRLLVEKAKQGKNVVRLKGGDPYIFGRGAEEALSLADNNISFEVIPGITSAIAVSAYAGIPLTHRDYNSCLTLITGHEAQGKGSGSLNWDVLAHTEGTLVFYMGLKNIGNIAGSLRDKGKPASTPCIVVKDGSLPTQKVCEGTLEDIEDKAASAGLTPPCLIIVGKTTQPRKKLAWFENLPLFGRSIVITRPSHQNREIQLSLTRLGAEVLIFPVIRIEKLPDNTSLNNAFRDLASYNWIVFTSTNGVNFFMEALFRRCMDVRSLHGIDIAVIGLATLSALKGYGLSAKCIPDEYISDALAASLRGFGIGGKKVLLPRVQDAPPHLVEGLVKAGADVCEVPLYRVEKNTEYPAGVFKRIIEGKVDIVTFTSSSTVSNFTDIIGKGRIKCLDSICFASIGPRTSDTARALGLKIGVEAKEHTSQGLVEAIRTKFSKP